jgi:hypothetical protein
MDFQEVAARLQAWAAEFLSSKQKLFDAKRTLESLLSSARMSGSVKVGEKVYTLSELESMYQENAGLLQENIDLERRFLSAMEELKTIKAAMEQGAEFYTEGFPGIAVGVGSLRLAGGLDAVPVAAIAWATGAAILIGTIAYFMSRVKSHIDRLAGATAGGLISAFTIALIVGGAYLLLGRK